MKKRCMVSFLKNIDKKTLKVAIIGVCTLVGLIIFIAIIVRLTEKTYYDYEQLEKKLVQSAQNYYNVNNSYLPVTEKNTSTVTVNSLVVGGFIEPLENLLKDGQNCTAQVVVTKIGNNYEYTPYLDCGSAYQSKELYNKVLEDNSVVSEGMGLYKINAKYVFRGEVKNNYVLINQKPWRILGIDENNNLVLLSEFRTVAKTWDDRYNTETEGNYGINDYNVSRIKESLESDYTEGELFTDSEKSKLVYEKLCVGKRLMTDTGNVECNVMSTEEHPIGLLTVYDYIQASLDEKCKTLEDKTCTNYNFILDNEISFWSITPSSKNTSYAYYITTSGVYESKTSTSKQVRYKIKLSTKAIYSSGSGTKEDPYLLR